MPELPEITVYLEALDDRIREEILEGIRVRSPSLLKTWDPPLSAVAGRRVVGLRRLGKRIVVVLEGDLFLVLHLMITGRLQWKARGAPIPRRSGHAAFDFSSGTLILTEAGSKKRASLHLVPDEEALAAHDPGGVEPLETDLEGFSRALLRENRTLKRALTDPRLVSGVGNAHSDEILLEAGLSPVRRTRQLTASEMERLYRATRASLERWIGILREEVGDEFPKKITAFHPRMGAHGRYGEPCPRCGSPIQRIVYAERETNYCPTCQTGGRLLADRGLSRLLGEDWPRTLEELEELRSTTEERKRRVKTILLADDNDDSRTVYATLLEHEGYRVLEAEDGFAALDVIRGETPDLVVLNLLMPRLDGHSVLEKLREDPATADIRCLFLTGDVRPEQMGKAVKAGADGYLTKPARPRQVLETVRALLGEGVTPADRGADLP